MATLRIKARDGKTLRITVPEGTDPSTYNDIGVAAEQRYMDSKPPMMDEVAGQAVKDAVMPLTAPATLMAGQDPTQMPDAGTIGNVAEAGKKAWETAGIPAKGIEGLTSLGGDAIEAFRHGRTLEGNPPEEWLRRAADVTEGREHLPRVAGFLAGALDPRYMALGEVINEPIAKGLKATAEAMQTPANWLAKRVMQFSKKMVGNQYARGMADAAAEFATKPHPEIQQAIMDITERAAPKAAGPASEAASAGESLVRKPPAPTPGQLALPAPAETGLTVPEKALATVEPEGPILEGEVVGGPKGAEYDPNASVGESFAPKGIDSLGRPTVHATVDTGEMYNHVDEQLKSTGKAIEDALKGLDESGEKWNPKPILKQLSSMYHRNQSGSVISPFDFSAQGEYNQAVDKIIKTIKAAALDNEGNLHDLSWKEANQLKGVIQKMANYQKPKFDPENMAYSAAGATIRDSIDRQGARIMASQGQDIQAFQAVRDAYSKLKVMEEALNNKFAGEESMKNVLPVLRTVGAATAMASGHPKTAAAILADYLIREYGPQTGAQMFRSIAENAGGLANIGGQAARAAPSAANAVQQGLQGD